MKLSPTIIAMMLITSILLSGCSTLISSILVNEPLSQPRYLSLMSTPTSLVGTDWLEKFTFEGMVKQSMLVQTEFRANKVSLVAMSFEGIPLLQASFDGTKVISETGIETGLDPQQIFHDMQSIYWPLDLVKRNLLDTVNVSEEITPDSTIRYFYRQQHLVRKIQYNKNTVVMNDLKHNYILTIIRLEDSH